MAICNIIDDPGRRTEEYEQITAHVRSSGPVPPDRCHRGVEWAVPMTVARLLAAAIRPRALAVTVVALAAGVFGVTAARASTTVALDGSFSTALIKPDFAGLCPSGVAGECGTVELVGLGAADWTYTGRPSNRMAAASMWTARSR